MRQIERSSQSSEALVQATARLITAHGLHGFTIDQVAEASGYSRGLVAARFGSKDGLCAAVFTRLEEEWVETQERITTSTAAGLDRLIAAVEALAGHSALDPLTLWAVVLGGPSGDPLVRARVAALTEHIERGLATFVRHGQDDGTVGSQVDAELEASNVFALLLRTAHQHLLHGPTACPGPTFDDVGRLIACRLQAFVPQGDQS